MIDTDADDFISFFERHQSTLERVPLEDIRLWGGSWIDVLEAMKQTNFRRCVDLREANGGG